MKQTFEKGKLGAAPWWPGQKILADALMKANRQTRTWLHTATVSGRHSWRGETIQTWGICKLEPFWETLSILQYFKSDANKYAYGELAVCCFYDDMLDVWRWRSLQDTYAFLTSPAKLCRAPNAVNNVSRPYVHMCTVYAPVCNVFVQGTYHTDSRVNCNTVPGRTHFTPVSASSLARRRLNEYRLDFIFRATQSRFYWV